MSAYIEITLRPDPEISVPVILNALYTKLHKALFDLTSTSIGVDFPASDKTLGDKLRLHGLQDSLVSFSDAGWLGGLSGYCVISDILEVPQTAKHRTVSRWQPTMSESNLRRLIKRAESRGEGFTEEQIKDYRAKMFKEQMTELPYVELQSGSNGHKHRRYIQFGELRDTSVEGRFDTFGLSKTATVPWF